MKFPFWLPDYSDNPKNKFFVLRENRKFKYDNKNWEGILNMITGINKSKILKNIYHVNVNVSSLVSNFNQFKSGITINIAASVKVRKNIICAKNLYFESCYI